MNHHISKASSLLALALCLPASAAELDRFEAWAVRVGTNYQIHARIEGEPGEKVALFIAPPGNAAFKPNEASLLAVGYLDGAGRTSIVTHVPDTLQMPANFGVELVAATRGSLGYSLVSQWLPLQGQGGTTCQDFTANYTIGDGEPVAGLELTDQWSIVNLAISAVNGLPGHPNKAIVFDSANPTGDDFDLETPGYGIGNTEPWGNLIIVAENDLDLNLDGLVDVPDDEWGGGVIRFDFAAPYRMCSATVVDIDEMEQAELRFYIGAAMALEVIPLVSLGDNSVQTLFFDKRDVRRFELVLSGSGALAHLGMVPCPMRLDFNETPFGRPRNLPAGTTIADQFADMGVTIEVIAGWPGFPDIGITFDSENPTGDDFDLLTPGPGINNSEALGLVLIIAENVVDLNMDGLVDDPDDSWAGGQIQFTFTEPVTFAGATVLDIDGNERDVFTLFDEAEDVLSIVEIDALGDNSVQLVETPAPVGGIRRIQANMTGSGAHTHICWCPDSNILP
jgi:hypothetical protein